MTSPPFHQDLFDECDARGRAAVTTHFLFNGFLDIKPNPNIYDWDLIYTDAAGHQAFIEIEVKRIWKSGPFPFDSIHIPERKGDKALKEIRKIYFWVLRDDLKMAVVVPSSVLAPSMRMEVSNTVKKEDEFFYLVGRDDLHQIDLDGWE